MATQINLIRPEAEEQTKKPSYASWGRRLLIDTLAFTAFVSFTGCAVNSTIPSSYYETQNKEVDARGWIDYEGERYYTEFRLGKKLNTIAEYVNGKYWQEVDFTKTVERDFGGKFEVTRMILGNPSLMIVGIDAHGNYGFMICDSVFGGKITPITSQLQAKKMKELGIRVTWRYDEKKRIFIEEAFKGNQKVGGSIYTEEGEELEDAWEDDYFR